MLNEFNRGMQITDEIMLGKAGWDKLFEAPSFFFKYRHFIVLLVTSNNADDHLEWCGLVESKIRYLIQNLERNLHINLAHVNPKCFEQQEQNQKDDGGEGGKTTLCSLWFIGLEFERSENLNVDLTESIQNFTDAVHKHAVHIKVLKDGMKIEARHVRRKQLNQYLDPNLLKRERKNSDSGLGSTALNTSGGAAAGNNTSGSGTTLRKRQSSEALQAAVASKKGRNDSFDHSLSNSSSSQQSSISTTTPAAPAPTPSAEAPANGDGGAESADAAASAVLTLDESSSEMNQVPNSTTTATPAPAPAPEVVCS